LTPGEAAISASGCQNQPNAKVATSSPPLLAPALLPIRERIQRQREAVRRHRAMLSQRVASREAVWRSRACSGKRVWRSAILAPAPYGSGEQERRMNTGGKEPVGTKGAILHGLVLLSGRNTFSL